MTRREISALLGQLEKTDKRSEYCADSQGISNSIPLQAKTKKMKSKKINFSMQEKATISFEKENFLKKGAVDQVYSQKDQFRSNIFIVKKKGGGNRPVINLKKLNQYVPFLHFKMERLQSLMTPKQKIEYMYKLDLKDAYALALNQPHIFS